MIFRNYNLNNIEDLTTEQLLNLYENIAIATQSNSIAKSTIAYRDIETVRNEVKRRMENGK